MKILKYRNDSKLCSLKRSASPKEYANYNHSISYIWAHFLNAVS